MKYISIVIIGHVFIVGVFFYFKTNTSQKKPHKHAVVKTYIQNNPPPQIAKTESLIPKPALPIPPPQLPEEPIQQPSISTQTELIESIPSQERISISPQSVKPAPKVTNQKKRPSKNPKQTTTISAAKKEQPKKISNQEKLVTMMQKSLHTLSASHQSANPRTKTIVTPNLKLASESFAIGTHYDEEIAAYLEAHLCLPEKGSIKIELTLKREGCVQKLKVINASSERNKSYIHDKLTDATFPPFGQQFKGELSHTFTITLSTS